MIYLFWLHAIYAHNCDSVWYLLYHIAATFRFRRSIVIYYQSRLWLSRMVSQVYGKRNTAPLLRVWRAWSSWTRSTTAWWCSYLTPRLWTRSNWIMTVWCATDSVRCYCSAARLWIRTCGQMSCWLTIRNKYHSNVFIGTYVKRLPMRHHAACWSARVWRFFFHCSFPTKRKYYWKCGGAYGIGTELTL